MSNPNYLVVKIMRSQEIIELKAKINSTSAHIALAEKKGVDVSLLSKKLTQYNSELSDLLRKEGDGILDEIQQPRG